MYLLNIDGALLDNIIIYNIFFFIH